MARVYVLACMLISCLMLDSISAVQRYVDGDVDILVNGSYWKCDRIICPENTYKCVVIIKTKSDTELRRSNVCHDEKGTVIKESKTLEAQRPGERKSLKIEVYENGLTTSAHSSIYQNVYDSNNYSYQSGNAEAAEKINQQIQNYGQEVQQKVQQQVHDQLETLQHQLGDVLGNLP